MQPLSWQVIGTGGSGLKHYTVEGLIGPKGIAARIVSDIYPPIELRGLYPDVRAVMAAAIPIAAEYFS